MKTLRLKVKILTFISNFLLFFHKFDQVISKFWLYSLSCKFLSENFYVLSQTFDVISHDFDHFLKILTFFLMVWTFYIWIWTFNLKIMVWWSKNFYFFISKSLLYTKILPSYLKSFFLSQTFDLFFINLTVLSQNLT